MLPKRACFFVVLLLVFAVSCNEEKETPVPDPVSTNKPVVNIQPDESFTPVDISPMDMIYFPVDYPVLKMAGQSSSQPVMRLIYSRPHREGRKIFGQLLKYGEPWRLGANEATEIEFFKTVSIQGKRIAAGRYILYCIPHPDKWIVAINTNTYAWGLKIQPEKDVQRFEIPVSKSDMHTEFFTMLFEENTEGADLLMTWDDVIVRLPITF